MLQITEEVNRLLSDSPPPPPSGDKLQPLRTFTFNHTETRTVCQVVELCVSLAHVG